MDVALWRSVARREIADRLGRIPGVNPVPVDNIEQLIPVLASAEVLAVPAQFYDERMAAALRDHGRRLRLIQLLSAGYEKPQLHGVPPGVLVATAGESWSPAVAEHAFALLLAMVKCLPQVFDNQSRHSWDLGFYKRMGSLYGSTLAIIGFGSIGREVAQRAVAFGMHVIGISRSATPHRLADEVLGPAALCPVLSRADVIVIAAPYTPETERLIGAKELAACKPGALLINVSRGGVVDSAALAQALRDGTIAGAALDVTDPEPLPAEHPLWSSPNLIISPHVAGFCGATGWIRLAAFVGENIERLASNQPLSHLVSV